MSRTYKDTKKGKKFDLRLTEHKSGVKKAFKRASNKKIRKTPITSIVCNMEYEDYTFTIPIPKNIVKGSTSTIKTVEITITVKRPLYEEVENVPIGLDIWSFE